MINNYILNDFCKGKAFCTFVISIFPFCVIIGSAAINIYFVVCSLLFFIFSKNKFINIFNNSWLKIFFFIIIYLCLISFFSENKFISFKSALSQFRFLFFILFIGYLSKNEFSKKNYLKWMIILISFVALDGIYQFFNDKNLFGFNIDPQNPQRLGGVFDQELILGSFIFLSCIPIISVMLNNLENLNIIKKIFSIFFIFLCFVSILLSGERMSFLLFCFSFILLSFIYFSYKKVLFLFVILISLTFGFIAFNKSTSIRANQFYTEISLLKHNNHIRLFSSAINVWKENIFFGVGLKNYRIKCDVEKLDIFTKKNNLCSTHPHNFYIEILTETGLIGLILYLMLFAKITQFILLNIRKIDDNLKSLFIGCASIIFCYLWPIKSSGSFFSTFTASFFWYNISIIYFIIKISTIKNSK